MSHIEYKSGVELFIRERTHKYIVLKVLGKSVASFSLVLLCLDVGSSPDSPCDPTVVSEPRFDEGFEHLLVSKVF